MSGYRKVAYLGIYSSLAILLGYLEHLIPPLTAVPGVKLGLPNLAVLAVLYLCTWKEALSVSLIRIVIIGVLFGNLNSFFISLCGGMLSLICMALLKYANWFDCIGISLVGGITHNIGQIAAAVILFSNVRVAYYFIPLAISGTVTGIIIGIVSGILIKRLTNIAPRI